MQASLEDRIKMYDEMNVSDAADLYQHFNPCEGHEQTEHCKVAAQFEVAEIVRVALGIPDEEIWLDPVARQ